MKMESKSKTCMEDKKCRICGLADTCNINIFTSANAKTLIRKILTVYPIVMYQQDPLPKNICKKCINNVNYMYTDIERVMRTQEKWTDNVRRIQPNNDYVRIMDLLENSSNVTLKSVKTAFQVDIQRIPGQIITKDFPQSTENSNQIINNTRVEVNGPAFQQIQQSLGILKVKSAKNSTPEIKELKTMLALNGCTLRAVNATKSKLEEDTRHLTLESEQCEVDIPLNNCMETESLSGIRCSYCKLRFDSQSSLASHQMQHLRLSIPRLCEKKYLEKNLRKGRVITVQDRKCIRCLNCWLLFGHNKEILNHWLRGECDFYCHICGEEFPTSPKLLRNHVPKMHGISYRSSKIKNMHHVTHKVGRSTARDQRQTSNKGPIPRHNNVNLSAAYKDTKDSTKQNKERNSAKTIAKIACLQTQTNLKKVKQTNPLDSLTSATCNICYKTFNNFKACNSHMRKHKPSYIYGDIVLSPHAYGDGYSNIDPQFQEASEERHSNNFNVNPYSWSTGTQHAYTNKISKKNFVTRQVDVKTSTGIRIRSITEMQKFAQPHRTFQPNVITAESTNSLNCWLESSNATTLNTAEKLFEIKEIKVKEEPKELDST